MRGTPRMIYSGESLLIAVDCAEIIFVGFLKDTCMSSSFKEQSG
jgi:hypothetical protein